MDRMERVEIAIIGTGPGGVSAALTASNRNKRILLLGSREMSMKVARAHEIRNYPGLPMISGADLAAAFRFFSLPGLPGLPGLPEKPSILFY